MFSKKRSIKPEILLVAAFCRLVSSCLRSSLQVGRFVVLIISLPTEETRLEEDVDGGETRSRTPEERGAGGRRGLESAEACLKSAPSEQTEQIDHIYYGFVSAPAEWNLRLIFA